MGPRQLPQFSAFAWELNPVAKPTSSKTIIVERIEASPAATAFAAVVYLTFTLWLRMRQRPAKLHHFEHTSYLNGKRFERTAANHDFTLDTDRKDTYPSSVGDHLH